jgi:hypothetical protein
MIDPKELKIKRPSIRSKLTYTLVRDLHIHIDHLESQLKERDEIIRELWQTWVFLAEAGQINYGVKWGKNYDRIKEQIETLKIKLSQKEK